MHPHPCLPARAAGLTALALLGTLTLAPVPVVAAPAPVGPGCCDAFTDLGSALPGTHGAPQLLGGGTLVGGTSLSLELSNARENAAAWLVVGLSNLALPINGGTLVPAPDLVVGAATAADGTLDIAATWPWGVPFGTEIYLQWWIQDPVGPFDFAASNALVGATPEMPVPGAIAPSWISGTDCASDPPVQVQQYDENTFIFRQSMCTNFEGPFTYLFIGEGRALLLDSGANGGSMGAAVYGVLNQWKADHGVAQLQLTVAHTHSHGDHIAGDNQFNGQPNTTVVGTSTQSVINFFGFQDWPLDQVTFALGGRILDVLAIPGHQASHIAVYDRETGLLITGDTLYPGFLFIAGAVSQGNFTTYKASIQRLVDFVADKPVTHVLGTHIEMTATPGVAYPYGTNVQPNERVLELDVGHLLELNAAVQAMGNNPQVEVHDDFIIQPSG